MANTKKYVSLDKLGLYDEKIKKVISDADAAALASAKEYADGLADNYEAAGTIATAQQALQKNIDAVDAKADAAQAAADKAQGEVDALETLVGTLPEGTAATSVVDYVNVKTAGIATDAALGELNNQISGLQTVVNGISADYLKAADKIELSDAISAEETRAKGVESDLETRLKAVEDDYLKAADAETLQGNIDGVVERVAAIEGDYLKTADKTELEGKIGAKADQTALDAEIERATKAEASLQTQINTIMNNPDTEGVINSIEEFTTYVTEHGTIADGFRSDIDANADAIEAMDTAYKAADEALAGRLDVLEAVDHEAYKAADTALKTELEGKINAKADASAVTAVEEDIAELQEADADIIERVAAVEAQLGDGEGSVADLIADAKAETLTEAAAAAATKDAETLASAKTYTDEEIDKVEATVTTLSATVDGKAAAADLTALTGRVTTAEGEIDTLQTEMDAVEALAAANDAAHKANAAAIALKADTSALTAVSDRVTTLETWHNNFTEVSEEEINALFTT